MDKPRVPPKLNRNSKPREANGCPRSQMDNALLAKKTVNPHSRLLSVTAEGNAGIPAVVSPRLSESRSSASTWRGGTSVHTTKIPSETSVRVPRRRVMTSALAREAWVTPGRGESAKCAGIPPAASASRPEMSAPVSAREVDIALPPSTADCWAEKADKAPCDPLKSELCPGENHLIHYHPSAGLRSDDASATYITPIASHSEFEPGDIYEFEDSVKDDCNLGFTLAAVFSNEDCGDGKKKNGQAASGSKKSGDGFQMGTLKRALRDQAARLKKLTARFSRSWSASSEQGERSKHRRLRRSSEPRPGDSLIDDGRVSSNDCDKTYDEVDVTKMYGHQKPAQQSCRHNSTTLLSPFKPKDKSSVAKSAVYEARRSSPSAFQSSLPAQVPDMTTGGPFLLTVKGVVVL